MYSFVYTYRVCYADTDRMGYMYYGNYARLYEIGRVEAIRNLGLDYRAMEEQEGIILPVVDVHARFLAPAMYDEVLTVETILHSVPGKMIVFENVIFNESQACIHRAEVKLFFVNKNTGLRISCPASIIEKVTPYFHE